MKNNRILMVGVFDVAGSTNIAMRKGFERLGYDVDWFNYRTVQSQLGTQRMWGHFKTSLIGNSYDLIVFCKTDSMHPQILNDVKPVAPTWYWFMDPMSTARNMHAATFAQNATFASATSSDVAERFSMVNKNTHHIFEGYNPSVYYYEGLKKIHDVIFIGNATIPRIIAINDLRKAGVDVSIFGKFWPEGMHAFSSVTGEDERIEINQSRVVLNLVQDDTIFSDRVIKSLGCGALVISQPCKDLLNSHLTSGVYTYNNTDHFINVYNNILTLSGLGPAKAMDFADNSSWKAVCSRILGKVEEYNESSVR